VNELRSPSLEARAWVWFPAWELNRFFPTPLKRVTGHAVRPGRWMEIETNTIFWIIKILGADPETISVRLGHSRE